MSHPNFSLDPLESRRLLSASPATAAALDVRDDCPEVIEARATLQEVAAEYHRDRRAGRAELAEIRAEAVKVLRELFEEKGEEIREAIAPLREALADAISGQAEQRRALLAALGEVREKWQPILADDLKAYLDARASGDEEAIKEAGDKLVADRNALKAELLPIKQDLDELMKDTRAAITAAHQAIEDKLAEFSDDYADLLDQLRAKAAELETELRADHEAVVSAQQALHDAIADCRAEHAGAQATATA